MEDFAPAAARHHGEEDESYFISMTDLMVGLVFIFIVMLVFFAMQLRETTSALTDAAVSRDELLRTLEQRLRARGVQATAVYQQGILRLPDEVLFDKGSSTVTPRGREALRLVAAEMSNTLGCYAHSTDSARPGGCPARADPLEAVFVEGHTDSDPIAGGQDNWDLSVRRATNTYRAIAEFAPALTRLRNRPPGEPDALSVLSVSGYGPTRPVAAETSEEGKRRNRRIDIRFVMATPESPD